MKEGPVTIRLSEAQQGLWIAEQELDDPTAFGCTETIRLSGPLDPERWRTAVAHALHETTATRVALVDDEQPRLVLLDQCPVSPTSVDLRVQPQPEMALQEHLATWQATPIDLSGGTVTHVALFRLDEQEWAWSWRVHHLALDGFGFALLARRVVRAWDEASGRLQPGSLPGDLDAFIRLATQKPPALPDDSALAHRHAIDLGTSGPRPGQAGAGSTHRVVWDLPGRMRPEEALAAIARAVHRASGATTCSIGLFTAARTSREALQTPTCLQDVVPVLVEVDAWTSQDQLQERVADSMRKALATAGCRQERRLRALGGAPLADVWANIVPFDQEIRLGQAVGHAISDWEGPVSGLTVGLRPRQDSTTLVVEAPDHDPREVVEGFAALLREILGHSDRDADTPVPATVTALPDSRLDDEAVRSLLTCSPTARLVAPDATLDATALHDRVASLAHALVDAGADGDHPVVLALPRVADAIAGQLAALQMGIPFVTADPELGLAHLQDVVTRSGAVAVLHHPAPIDPSEPAPIWRSIDPRALATRHTALPRLRRPARPWDTAYVMWTSGSTGRPKGVVVTRANLAALVRRHVRCLHPVLNSSPDTTDPGITARVSHNHPFTFDSALSPLAALLRGAEMHLTPEHTTGDPAALACFCLEHRIDMLDVSPAVLAPMVEDGLLEDPRGPRLVVVGGDACPTGLWDRLASAPVSAWNAYGPTEATVDATGTWIEAGSTPHLGEALPGVEARVLDASLRPCPDGVAGELYLAGDGVAEGYLNAAALTAERFVPDPWGVIGSRMYRTGDLVRRSPGGLRFLGRTDAQMSIRGRRVEPGEVEAVLDRLPGVARSAVRLVPGPHGPILVAAVVSNIKADERWRRETLESTRAALPPALHPAALMVLDALPLTDRGKLDRDRLPIPELGTDEDSGALVAPEGPLEEHLASRAAEVLGQDRVGADSDLRSLGLHSLASARLVALLRADLGVPVRVADVAAYPSVRALAAELIRRGATGTPPEEHTVELQAPESPQPARPAQARLVYLEETDQVQPATYVVPVELTLHGELDWAALRQALTDVITAHRALRSRLVTRDDVLLQEPVPAEQVAALLQITEPGPAGGEEWTNWARRGFDLARELPIRVALASNGDEHRVLLCLHHVAADGASIGPLLKDLTTAYTARRAGHEPAGLGGDRPGIAPAIKVNEADREADLAAWREELSGAPATTRLPLDRPRPRRRSGVGDQVTSALDQTTTRSLRAVANQTGGTLFSVLHAALAGLLTRWGAGDDVVLGAVLSTRSPDDEAVGFAVDTVPLRTDLSGRPSFAELCHRVAIQDLAVFSRVLDSRLGLDDIVRAVNPARDSRYHPLFQTVLVLQEPEEVPDLSAVGLSASVQTLPTGTAKFDLTLEATPTLRDGDEWLDLRWEYATDVLDATTVARLDASFHHLLSAWIAQPDGSLWDPAPSFDAVPPRSASAPDSPMPWGPEVRTLADAWREAVKRHGARVALTEDDRNLNYGEVHAAAEELAGRLQAAGVCHGDLVALSLGRGSCQIIAILATVLAGASYVPLDPAYPMERLALVLDDSRPRVLVVDTRQEGTDDVRRAAAQLHIPELDLGETTREQQPQSRSALLAGAGDDIAYVLYTSGSTGRPKGVRVTHHDVLRLFETSRDLIPCGPDDVWTMFHSYAFDFSVWEMYGALLHGGRLVVVPHQTTRDPAAFASLVDREKVTVLNQTPSAMTHFIAEATRPDNGLGFASLRTVVLGGEALDPRTLRPWWECHGSRVKVVNMYGITETTVHVTYRAVSPDDLAGSPVGVALPDLSVRLLDEGLHPVPPGAVGEIYVAGPGLSEGYLGRLGLTATRFVPDPWGPPGSRMYRSGDLAVVDAHGSLDFCGRGDDQVQLRGFRVELGEVEAALTAVDQVAAAHVIVHEEGTDQAALVGYVTGPDPAEADPMQILAAVRAQVPPQSVPSTVVVLETFPLTVNGKLDSAALPRPETARRSASRAPKPGLEEQVARAFAATLGVDGIGATENFFEIGGHSLTAVRALRRLEQATGSRVSIGTLFAHPTPESLAAHLQESSGTTSVTHDLASLLVLRPVAEDVTKPPRPGVFCLHPAGGLAWCYSGLAAHLPSTVALWGLQARGLSGGPTPSSLGEMSQDYLDQILAAQSEGPYHLLGWSLGGMVAHEVAVRLRELGHEVGLLALLDAYPSEGLAAGEEREAADAYSALLAMAGIDDRELVAELNRPLVLDDCVAALHASEGPMADLDRSAIETLRSTYAATAAILTTHQHRHFDGTMHFYRAARGGATNDGHSPEQWRDLVNELRVVDVDANHRQMTRPVPLAAVGRDLAQLLQGQP